MVRGDHALERRFDDRPRCGRDHEERELAAGDALGEHVDQLRDVLLEADATAGLDEVLAPDGPELRIVAKQVGEFASLMHEVAAGQARDLLLEAGSADELAQHHARVVEAQGLVEVAEATRKCTGSVMVDISLLGIPQSTH